MGGILALRGRHMDRTLLLWAGARGGGGALRAIARYDPQEGPPWRIPSITCSGWGILHGSLAITGWGNSSASP